MFSGSHPVSMYWSVCPAALMEVCGDRKLAWRYAFTLLRPMNKDLQLQRVERTSAWITGEINGNVTVNQASVFNHCSSLSTSHFVETDCLYSIPARTEYQVRCFGYSKICCLGLIPCNTNYTTDEHSCVLRPGWFHSNSETFPIFGQNLRCIYHVTPQKKNKQSRVLHAQMKWNEVFRSGTAGF